MLAERARRTGVRFALAGMLLPIFGGCGGGDFGMAVRVPPERQLPVETGAKKYPADQPFNICDAQRTSTGDAEAEGDAAPDGTAFCATQAKAGGTASAEFQLGQCLHNRGKAKTSVLARFTIDYLTQISSSADPATGTSGKLALQIYVKDSRERVVRKQDLLAADSELGPAKGQQKEISEFAFDMEPNLVYHYVLAGKADASSADKTNASARIDIKSLQIDLQTKPAPAAKQK